MEKITIALAGNPNCGKTTLFNALTGSRQRVGNWPGVTVERIDGQYRHDEATVQVVDLPGIYSFSAYSIDETIAREYILHDRPAVVVNIIDATNLERNLYLTTQLLEMKVPLVVALNMTDLARQRKLRIEVEHLARHLDCPVIPMVATKKTGLAELKDAIAAAACGGKIPATRVAYDSELEEAIDEILPQAGPIAERNGLDGRWLAVKLLEGDELAEELSESEEQLAPVVEHEVRRIEKHTGDDIDMVIADGRYGFIHGLSRDVLHRRTQVRRTVSDVIDKVALNRLLGIPIFLAVMYLIFMVTINVGGPFIDFFDGLCGAIFVDGFRVLLESLSAPAFLTALLADGVGGGIQTVATFIPPIFFIFLCLSILEDSGYMARAAFVMDRLLRAIGLPGKAFIPMLVGFGCNVPAILATRTLENRRDRIMTIIMNPFMSCGARLPVYVLFAKAFFPQGGGTLIFCLYLTGIFLAVLTGLLLKKTILTGEASTFVMELPPYHLPTIGGIMHHTWHRLRCFLLRAGKVIIVVVIVLSFLNSIGFDADGVTFGNEGTERSALSSIGRGITPVFGPMGITQDNWPASVGLFTGIFAKEAVVGTLNSLYEQMDAAEAPPGEAEEAQGEPFDLAGRVVDAFRAIPEGFEGFLGWGALGDPAGVREAASPEAEVEAGDATIAAISRKFPSRAAAIAYLLFILIYAPCVAAIMAIYNETNLGWTVFAVAYLTGLAWIAGTVFYQVSSFAANPWTSAFWLGVVIAALAAFYIGLKIKSRGSAV